jgi:hypothetical protein
MVITRRKKWWQQWKASETRQDAPGWVREQTGGGGGKEAVVQKLEGTRSRERCTKEDLDEESRREKDIKLKY